MVLAVGNEAVGEAGVEDIEVEEAYADTAGDEHTEVVDTERL